MSERIPTADNSDEKKEAPKTYLYHEVPEDMQGDVVHPLNTLKDLNPVLCAKKVAKYDERKEVMDIEIETLKCKWNDVIHLAAVDPRELKRALVEAGLKPEEKRFYQIDPEMLDPEKTTIYLYDDKDSLVQFDPKKLAEHARLPEATKAYYKRMIEEGKRPLLFVGIPHIFHKGSIDVSKLPVITA